MNSAAISIRRVVFGITGQGSTDGGLELALEMAKAMGVVVSCLLPERRDLLAAAGLPFARITSHRGLSLPVTDEDMAASLRRQQRKVEESVTTRCRSAGLNLSIERPPGEYASSLLSCVAEGDVVVVEYQPGGLPELAQALLWKVNVVILPGSGDARPQTVLSVSHEAQGPANTMAENIATALGLPLKYLTPFGFLSTRTYPGIIVAPPQIIAELGGIANIRKYGGRASTLILVRNGV